MENNMSHKLNHYFITRECVSIVRNTNDTELIEHCLIRLLEALSCESNNSDNIHYQLALGEAIEITEAKLFNLQDNENNA